MYLLGRYGGWPAQDELWGYLADQLMLLHFSGQPEQLRMQALMHQYRDLPMDLADASLVVTADILNRRQVFTLDGDFRIYRFQGNQFFDVVP